MKISIIIPVFGSTNTLNYLCSEIEGVLRGLCDYEIIIVHDGAESSGENLKYVPKEPGSVRVRHFCTGSRKGQHGALLEGMKYANGEYVVTMDDDGQHDPAYIPEMLKKMENGGYDVVYAVFSELQQGKGRVAGSKFLRRLLSATVPGISPFYSPFRMLRNSVVNKLLQQNKPWHFIDGYLGMLNSTFGRVEAIERESRRGKSSYNLFGLIRHAALIIYYYSGRKRGEKA